MLVPETVGISDPNKAGFGQAVSLIDLDGDAAAELLAAADGAVSVYSPTGRNAPVHITPEQRDDDFGYPLN
ncbi:hypothetical protein [Nonomuraea roseola]|uniref:Uncharacterized protein n=1 Tax=Nonomuraea roseola TaxID=46179 RepID=A0ABV5PRU2_9ACTN